MVVAEMGQFQVKYSCNIINVIFRDPLELTKDNHVLMGMNAIGKSAP